MSLRVGFDGRALTSPAAGVRRYTRELLRALSRLSLPLELVMLGGDPLAERPLGIPHIGEPPHPPTNAGWMLVGLPLAMRRGKVDLLHAPAYTAPFWSPAPVVLTIHDVSYARHPEWFPYRRDRLRRAFYRRSALSASAVITDSTFSATEIRAAYGIASEQITVVPLGVDSVFSNADARTPTMLPTGVAAPYLLHVGDLHERRNLSMLVRALVATRKAGGALSDLRLVLAGVDRGVGDGLTRQATDAGVAEAVIRLGKVDEAALRALYREAFALVYPSLYEGFGLPLLEAMASGTPVVAARAASLPEVVGDAGILLDPHDDAAWTGALLQLAADPGLASSLRTAGRKRAAQHNWDRTARATFEVYQRVAAAEAAALPPGPGVG